MNETSGTIQSMKGRFPFRLGTTSYIVPADLVPNVVFLSPLVDDVELVLFESDTISNLPDAAVISELAGLKRAGGISYTVHLPLDTELGSSNEALRRASVEKCLRVIDITRPLEPFAYILHFHGEARGRRPAQDLEQWRDVLDRSVGDMKAAGIEPEAICVETLDYPFELVSDIVSRHRLSVCIDIGHLLLYGYSVEAHFNTYLDRCRVMHIHGISNGSDHRHIGFLDHSTVQSVLERLCSRPFKERVLTIEVFSREDLEASLAALARFEKWRKSP